MTQFRKNSRKALAAFMSVWLSGIIFLFCCDMSAKAAEKEFCPLAKANPDHCNKAKDNRDNKDSRLASDDGSRGLSCCGFIPAVFDKTRKIERDVHATQPADKPETSPQTLSPLRQNFDTPAFYTSYRPIQDRIFIRHHVFRI